MNYSRKIQTSEKGDCAIRALSVAAHISYPKARRFISTYTGRKENRGTSMLALIDAMKKASKDSEIIKEYGFRVVEILNYYTEKNKKGPTLGRFLKEDGKDGRWMVTNRNHALAIVENEIKDWPCFIKKTRRQIKIAWKIEKVNNNKN